MLAAMAAKVRCDPQPSTRCSRDLAEGVAQQLAALADPPSTSPGSRPAPTRPGSVGIYHGQRPHRRRTRSSPCSRGPAHRAPDARRRRVRADRSATRGTPTRASSGRCVTPAATSSSAAGPSPCRTASRSALRRLRRRRIHRPGRRNRLEWSDNFTSASASTAPAPSEHPHHPHPQATAARASRHARTKRSEEITMSAPLSARPEPEPGRPRLHPRGEARAGGLHAALAEEHRPHRRRRQHGGGEPVQRRRVQPLEQDRHRLERHRHRPVATLVSDPTTYDAALLYLMQTIEGRSAPTPRSTSASTSTAPR
jgi:hypothetical protein